MFEWDEVKNAINLTKHKISFFEAQKAFFDANRVIAEDMRHSHIEKRYYCFGKIDQMIATVRFTYRDEIIRIIGAGYWREGKKIYEEAQADRL